jgi:hypothetical protein
LIPNLLPSRTTSGPVFAPNRSDQPFDKRMRQGSVGHRFNLCHTKYPKIRLPLVESVQRIVIRTEIFGNHFSTDGTVEHSAESDAVDNPGMNPKPDNAPGLLIHNKEHPIRPQSDRLAAEEVDAMKAVFHVAYKSEPGRHGVIGDRPVMGGENSSNDILILAIPNAKLIC